MDTAEQFTFVQGFNWDDGFGPIESILKADNCCLETALLAFWRAEGPWVLIGETQPEAEHSTFVKQLAQRIEQGRYRPAGFGFSPSESEGLSATQLYKFRQAGLPEVFFGCRNG